MVLLFLQEKEQIKSVVKIPTELGNDSGFY